MNTQEALTALAEQNTEVSRLVLAHLADIEAQLLQSNIKHNVLELLSFLETGKQNEDRAKQLATWLHKHLDVMEPNLRNLATNCVIAVMSE